jgi:protein CpxP
MNSWNRLLGVALVAVALAFAGQAAGQFPGGGNSGRTGGKGGDAPRAGMGERQGRDDAAAAPNMAAIVRFRLDQLEEDLRLAPLQRTAWQAYRDAVMTMAEDAVRAQRQFATGDLTAPQRLDRLLDVARNRLAAMEDIADSGKRLYSALTPAQQQVADRRLAVAVTPVVGVEPAPGSVRPQVPRGVAEPAREP